MTVDLQHTAAECSAEICSQLLNAWREYRAACFMRAGPLLAWYWTARHEFDFLAAGLHLRSIPGVRFDLGTHGLMIALPSSEQPDLHECHVVPLVRLSELSIDGLQPAAGFDVRVRIAELLAEQADAQAQLQRSVQAANLWRLPEGGTNARLQ